jgi:hypothetical protein
MPYFMLRDGATYGKVPQSCPPGDGCDTLYPLTLKSKTFSLVSEATRAAALLEREELLTSEARHLTEASYRRRAEIEEELAEVRRLLERLGLRDKNLN